MKKIITVVFICLLALGTMYSCASKKIQTSKERPESFIQFLEE